MDKLLNTAILSAFELIGSRSDAEQWLYSFLFDDGPDGFLVVHDWNESPQEMRFRSVWFSIVLKNASDETIKDRIQNLLCALHLTFGEVRYDISEIVLEYCTHGD